MTIIAVGAVFILATTHADIAPISAPLTPSPSHESFTFDPAAAADVNFSLIQDQPLPELFGTAGSAYWLVNAAGATDSGDRGLARAGFGLSYFLVEDLSIDLELNLGYHWQEGRDALGVNFNILFRWHFWHADDKSWTVYADGGAGMLGTTRDVPPGGSSFNFTPQAGVGASIALAGDTRLYLGARWFHISNARIFESNPGEDSGMAYAMIGWPF